MAIESDKLRERLERATAHLEPPYAVVDLTAFDANAVELVGLAAGKPVRLASKSVRSRELIVRALRRPGWRGVMAFTLPEAIWLVRAGVCDDVLVAYPTADRAALLALTDDADLAAAITLMIDSPDQLDLIDGVRAADRRPELR
ncbi:amino acid deaminase/aldolase, partial [Micromonospora azadirachtae]